MIRCINIGGRVTDPVLMTVNADCDLSNKNRVLTFRPISCLRDTDIELRKQFAEATLSWSVASDAELEFNSFSGLSNTIVAPG